MEEEWRGEKGRGENMRDWENGVVGKSEKENKEIDTLIERAIMGLARNLALGKFPGMHKDDPQLRP